MHISFHSSDLLPDSEFFDLKNFLNLRKKVSCQRRKERGRNEVGGEEKKLLKDKTQYLKPKRERRLTTSIYLLYSPGHGLVERGAWPEGTELGKVTLPSDQLPRAPALAQEPLLKGHIVLRVRQAEAPLFWVIS